MRSLRPAVIALGLFLLGASLSTDGRADPRAPGEPAPANGTPPNPAPLRGAMGQVAVKIASAVGPVVRDPMVFVGALRSDEAAPRAGELIAKLAALVAGALGPGASSRAEPVPLATAQTLAHKAQWLVYLQPEIARGQLLVTADAYRVTRNVWERARQPTPTPAAHAFANGRIDAELRAHLAPLPLVAGRVERIVVDERDILALACGDVGDGGSPELVTLSRRRVAVGRVRQGRFVVRRAASLRELSGVAPAPLREPIGGVAIVSSRGAFPSALDVGITDRARGSRLDTDLRPLSPITGVPVPTPQGDACATFQGSTLDASWTRCTESDPPFDATELEMPLDAGAGASFVTAAGAVRTVLATRDPRTAELRLRGDGRTASLPRSGAQVALGDLDQDGSPEIVSTLDTLPQSGGETDALVVTTWQPDGSLLERARVPVPAGIRAVAICPSEGAGPSAIVAATLGELWIVR